MKIYRFVSEPQSVRAFTADASGANLPAIYAPWSALDAGADVAPRGDADPVSAMVRRDGYFLPSGKGKASPKPKPRAIQRPSGVN